MFDDDAKIWKVTFHESDRHHLQEDLVCLQADVANMYRHQHCQETT